jgi:hypothetical protein
MGSEWERVALFLPPASQSPSTIWCWQSLTWSHLRNLGCRVGYGSHASNPDTWKAEIRRTVVQGSLGQNFRDTPMSTNKPGADKWRKMRTENCPLDLASVSWSSWRNARCFRAFYGTGPAFQHFGQLLPKAAWPVLADIRTVCSHHIHSDIHKMFLPPTLATTYSVSSLCWLFTWYVQVS